MYEFLRIFSQIIVVFPFIHSQIQERLYDFLSEQYTFDHPLCQVRKIIHTIRNFHLFLLLGMYRYTFG